MILIAVIFLTTVNLFLGVLFVWAVFGISNISLPFTKKEDKVNKVGEDFFSRPERVPIDQFVPRGDIPLKVKYSEKDSYTKDK